MTASRRRAAGAKSHQVPQQQQSYQPQQSLQPSSQSQPQLQQPQSQVYNQEQSSQQPHQANQSRGDKPHSPAGLGAGLTTSASLGSKKTTTTTERAPRVINAAPAMEKAEIYGIDDTRPVFSRAMAMAGRMFIETIPAWLAIGGMLALIFGGCCSNVFALEAIVKVEPRSGTLLTFVQFLFVAIVTLPSQFDVNRPPFFLKANKVPIRRWIFNIVLFFAINMLNNHAFSYDISVPVHIILRSGGSITTMIAGSLWGRTYTRIQVTAVILLTLGVIMAAWSDAQMKEPSSKHTTHSGSIGSSSSFGTGLLILFTAQALSAIMGLYVEETYRRYGPQWKENLFYSHLLSLPLFVPFFPSLLQQLLRLANSRPLELPSLSKMLSLPMDGHDDPLVPPDMRQVLAKITIPSQLFYLASNVLTQYACIRGVNLLASASSALSVTIVLNIRKLVSLLLSIWLFGNRLAPGTLLGAIIVFSSGALYSLSPQRERERPPGRKKMDGGVAKRI